ncbi:MAG: glycosyltransferase [Fervidobacterium sp.]
MNAKSILHFVVITSSLIISLIYYVFSKRRFLRRSSKEYDHDYFDEKISVIIPARNEEENIKKILSLLVLQRLKPHEIIVVDDNSTDETYSIAASFDDVRVIKLTDDLPNGWVGKSWAIWNGYLHSTGDILIFFDADVEPSNVAINELIKVHKKYGGLISVWPYQRFERFYEHLNLTFNLLIVYASSMFGFPYKQPSGAFGPVILTSREDYEKTGGHKAIKDSVLEDIKLGKLYAKNGIRITNLLGGEIIKIRMYPNGLKSLFFGFSKNISSGAISGGFTSFLIALIWMSGFYTSFSSLNLPIGYVFLKYLVFAINVFVLAKSLGDYKWYDALFYPLHFLFFLVVFLYSLYRTVFLKNVTWKGRKIEIS